MAENQVSNVVAGIIAFLVIAGLVRSCDDSPGYSSSGYSSAPIDDSDGELKAAVDDFETASQKLANVAFDESRTANYLDAIDDELARMDYDFDGVLAWETKSRVRFRNMLVEACRSRGIAPPPDLSPLGAPFDQSEASIDWGSSSDFSELPEGVRQWIAKQGEIADPLRQEVARLSAKQRIASKILELASLREELQGKLREANTLLRNFESKIDEIERTVRKEQVEKNITKLNAAMNIQPMRIDMETLLSKRAYAQYLTTFIDTLEAAIMDLQFIETQSRDEFAMTKLVEGEESRQLLEKIDVTLTKYRGTAFDRKLEVDGNETIENIWAEIQRMETTR